jgi:hypothetical protein
MRSTHPAATRPPSAPDTYDTNEAATVEMPAATRALALSMFTSRERDDMPASFPKSEHTLTGIFSDEMTTDSEESAIPVTEEPPSQIATLPAPPLLADTLQATRPARRWRWLRYALLSLAIVGACLLAFAASTRASIANRSPSTTAADRVDLAGEARPHAVRRPTAPRLP